MIIKESGGKDFENPEPGSHAAVCYKLVDIGTQHGKYMGKPTALRKVVVFWELAERMADGRPFSVCQYYTRSLGEKANLRKMLEGWRTRAFTEDELQGWDLRNILGKACFLSLSHTDKGKIKVAGVSPLPKGFQAPPQVNPSVNFDLDSFDESVFDSLDNYWKAKIMDSDEYKKALEVPHPADSYAGAGADDIPF